MSFGVDHPVVAVSDLASARTQANALGFLGGIHYVHPWGTENELILFGDTFIELIAITRPALAGFGDANGFRFARLIEARIRMGGGVAMAALHSKDMEHDHALIEAQGFAPWSPITFEWQARNDNGELFDSGVILDFLHDPAQPFLTQFLCQQLHPELLRPNGYFPEHPNGVYRVSALWYVSDNLERDIHFFRIIHGGDRISAVDGGYRISTDKADIWLVTPEQASASLPSLGSVAASPPRAVAISLETTDLEAAIQGWQRNDVPFERVSSLAAEVPAVVLGNTLLRFEQCEDCLW
ncbi:hypothetical protein R84981_002089 [Carnimonas sp. R-84981]|uniref:VOC family protein n=1 Tax=Carnimonas bestiolae TaxID=3402172 RepID=UPI003EDC1E47